VPSQSWNAETYSRNARFVAELGAPLLTLLDPRPRERILDVGCGDGFLTRQIAELGARVVGVDASEDLVRAALALGLDARVVDAEELAFSSEFDAVFSNAALHWMKRPERVVAGVHRALVPGGRLVVEFGGKGCVRTLVDAIEQSLAPLGIDARARSPWCFPSAEEYAGLLAQGGFAVKSASLFDRPTPLVTGVRGWLATFGGAFLAGLPPTEEERAISSIEERATPLLSNSKGEIVADYVRLRVVAEKLR